jgi:hypothetical protein
MSNQKDIKLAACFPGLIDVCEAEDGQLLYLVCQNEEFLLLESAMVNGSEVMPPEKEHFPFLLPQAETVMEYINLDDVDLYDDVLTYLKRFSALDDHQWAVVAHFVFLTYMHDHKEIFYCPILLFHAVAERGKSRTGKSVSYLSYRGIHLSELREANILRYCENLKSMLFFDIMDVWKKAVQTRCEDLLLGRFEKGQKASRVLFPEKGAFRDMKHYEIYGPTIIVSNEQLHKILDTRCLPITMPNLPGSYENPHPDTAQELKARLTAWRGRHFNAELPSMEPLEGISGRLWDIAKSLFLVNSLLDVNSDTLKDAIISIAGERSESNQDSIEGRLVAIIREITAEEGLDRFVAINIKISYILKKLNEERPADKQITPQWIGRKLKSMSIRHRTINGRSEIVLTTPEYKTLLDQYGFGSRDTTNPTETLPGKTEQIQHDTYVVGSSRVSGQTQAKSFTFNSPEERQVYFARMNELKEAGGVSRVEMERLAQDAVEQWRKDHDLPF